jgi:glycosyltransferase involved in cell wall biosynthesis
VKVAQYIPTLSRTAGGVFYCVSGLSLALKACGAEVTVIGATDVHFAADAWQWQDLDVRTYPATSRYGLHPRGLQLTSDVNAEIFHVHGIWSASSLYGRLARWQGKRTVVSPHGMLDPWILARRARMKSTHAALLERPLLRRSHVHALNEAEERSILRFEPTIADQVFVLPNGVPDVELPPERPRKGVLFLSRLHPKKQVLELIHNWHSHAFLARHHLTIAGWGDPEYELAVRNAVGRSPSISLVGSLYGPEKAEALASAKFLVLPSLSEGLPMSVLEAMNAGCVPIITDQCNLPELFSAGVAWRMNADFSDFRDVIQACLAMRPADYLAMSASGKTFAKRYSWNDIAKAMLTRYESMLVGG